MPSFRGSSRPRDGTHVSRIVGGFATGPLGKPLGGGGQQPDLEINPASLATHMPCSWAVQFPIPSLPQFPFLSSGNDDTLADGGEEGSTRC